MLRPGDLNYQHLRYFRAVAHVGSVVKAGRLLHLAPSTISGQIKTLERQLGQPLFNREGRSLVLSAFGETVLGYADQIFGLGDELVRTVVQGEKRERVRVGVSSVLPKLLVREVLTPAASPTVELHIEHGPSETLLGHLAARQLDVVLTDTPLPSWLGTRGTSHQVIETGIAVFGAPRWAEAVGDRLPQGLQDVPWLIPAAGTSLRAGLDAWWDSLGFSPDVAAVVDDSALLKALGDAGLGIFAAPASMTAAIVEAYDVRCIGTTNEVMEQVFAVTREASPSSEAIRRICGLDQARPTGAQ